MVHGLSLSLSLSLLPSYFSTLTVVQCPQNGVFPEDSTALIVNTTTFTFGSNVTYSCQEGSGRNLSGVDRITCLANGNWSTSPPTCLRKDKIIYMKD